MQRLSRLDAENEDTAVADANAAVVTSDRNAAAASIKAQEACGAFFGSIEYYLDVLGGRALEAMLALYGFTPKAAAKATVTLKFQATVGQNVDVPAGTVVQTAGQRPVRFETDSQITVPSGGTETVGATAVEAGDEGNVGADTLTELASPISGVYSVTNPNSASGGRDRESSDELVDRVVGFEPPEVPDTRLMWSGDVQSHVVAQYDDVDRAVTFLDSGAVTTHILRGAGLNETPDASRQSSIEDDLRALLPAGHTPRLHQPGIRLVQVTEVKVVYEAGADRTATDTRIEQTLADAVCAVEPIRGGVSQGEAWPWGRHFYPHIAVDLIDDVEGVERVGTIRVQTSDDYGSNWTAESDFTSDIVPGLTASGNPNDRYGLLHHATGHDSAPNYSGHNGFTVKAL